MPPQPSPAMSVLVVSGERVFPVTVPPDGELLVGRGAGVDVSLDDPKVAPRHLSLRPGRDGQLEVRDLKAGSTRLNDVQLSGASAARAGDQISLGDSLLLVQAAGAPATRRPSPVGHAEFEDRLHGELTRAQAAHRPLALLLVRLPGAASDQRQELLADLVAEARAAIAGITWGSFGGEVVELLCPESSGAALEELKDRVTSALGSRGQRFKLGPALYPEDGTTADELLESALSRLVGPLTSPVDEPMLLDPVMVRLHAILDRLSHSEHPVLLEGAPGVGKHTLARALHHRGKRAGARFRQLRCFALTETELQAALRRAAEEAGTVYLAGLDELPAPLQHMLAAALAKPGPARLIGACETAAALSPGLAGRFSYLRLPLPQLADRPADVLPLAEHFLARSRRALGKAGLSLSAEARKALGGYGWPGNVRELKLAIERAALLSSSNEVGADELPQRVLLEAASREPGGATGHRASMRAAEKD
ncbi:MAG: AAA-type ATPase lid domain-containing protein, partial [Myxococcaceae bacterium]